MENTRFLKKLEIENYRGFFERQVINFATPNGKSGSGLTLVTGPNNTGKTAIIEALQTNKEQKFSQEHRHQDGSDPCIVIYSDKEERCEFKNRAGGSLVIQTGEHRLKFEIIGSKKIWDHTVGGRIDGKAFQHDTGYMPVRNTFYQNLSGRLLAISENKEEKARFDAYMRKFFPRFQDWQIDTVSERDYVKYGENGKCHHAGLLGDGIICLFRICVHLLEEDKNSILIIDQPEDGLHPSVKKALSLFISELSKDKQIILCTHSPYFVNWDDFVNGAKFVRLNKTNNQCVVSELANIKNYGGLFEKNILDWQRPELLDICAKEIMFSEKILFVEGKEDVGLIRKYLREQNIKASFDIFGYGVGGYTRMKPFLEMAKDLGLEKIAALYDKETSRCFQEDKMKYKNFKLLELPTLDIRDKPESDGKRKKEGIFTEKGVMKDEYKNKFEEIMNEFVDFLEN